MRNYMKNDSEAARFDKTVRTILSVSREEFQKREKEWKSKRKKERRAKASPASRASTSKA
jgi:hypothetical protein